MSFEVSSVAASANPCQYLPASLDAGNGNIKFHFNGHSVMLPSYFADAPEGYELGQKGYFEYLAGPSSELLGRTILAGQLAYDASPRGVMRITDSRGGKPEYALFALLGAIAQRGCSENLNLGLVTSVPNADAEGEAMKLALEGEHDVSFNGAPSVSVKVKVLQVVFEGSGAILAANATGNTVVYDLGNGTTIAASYKRGSRSGRKETPQGVERLIADICNSSKLYRAVGQAPDPAIVRAAIEKGSFAYGTRGIEFQNIYQTQLKGWLSSTLKQAIAGADSWVDTADRQIAIGGGCKLPYVAAMLAQKGIEVLPDPVGANAEGMFRLAKHEAAKCV
jgi:hypothetical protein